MASLLVPGMIGAGPGGDSRAATPADGPAKATAGPSSGIEGETVIGPVRPSARIGDAAPNTAPFSATLRFRQSAGGAEVARVTSGADGQFRVELPPGEYVVTHVPDPGLRAPRAEAAEVTVTAGTFSRVTIRFDNGMR